MLHVTTEPRGSCIKHVLLLKQKILPLMKLGELYVHIYYYALDNIFHIKLLCIHDAMTCSIVALL